MKRIKRKVAVMALGVTCLCNSYVFAQSTQPIISVNQVKQALRLHGFAKMQIFSTGPGGQLSSNYTTPSFSDTRQSNSKDQILLTNVLLNTIPSTHDQLKKVKNMIEGHAKITLNGCEDLSKKVHLFLCDYKVYPNPNSGVICRWGNPGYCQLTYTRNY